MHAHIIYTQIKWHLHELEIDFMTYRGASYWRRTTELNQCVFIYPASTSQAWCEAKAYHGDVSHRWEIIIYFTLRLITQVCSQYVHLALSEMLRLFCCKGYHLLVICFKSLSACRLEHHPSTILTPGRVRGSPATNVAFVSPVDVVRRISNTGRLNIVGIFDASGHSHEGYVIFTPFFVVQRVGNDKIHSVCPWVRVWMTQLGAAHSQSKVSSRYFFTSVRPGQ